MKKDKTILEINTTNYASTGNITLNIAKKARENGYKVYTSCKASKESFKYIYEDQVFIGYRFERIISALLCSITGLRDHFNIFGTYSFISKIKKINPDLIHLHVLHDDFINTRIFFRYLSKADIPIIWTFHDCCAFTGKCPYFDIVGCNKWQDGCHDCPQLKIEAKSYFFDTTRFIWNLRKKIFTSPNDMLIVTPSEWLKDLVNLSFFKKYDCSVINNGIDLDVFKTIDNKVKEKYDAKDKYIILGVANVWSTRKGLDVFIRLADKLPKNYQIIMVGTNDSIDSLLPDNIISIHRTYNQKELIEIYSAADVFVNPTREENFPTVNIESLACGTPVITFDTGGSPEIIDSSCGSVVEKNNVDALLKEIIRVCEDKPYSKQACISKAKQFDMNTTFNKYIELYDKYLNI